MNRILIMGDKGFVGSHIRAALESTYGVVAAVKPCLKDRPEGTSDLRRNICRIRRQPRLWIGVD